NSVYQKCLPGIPAAVSFSAAMHSIMAVDEQGDPLSPCIIWADNRAVGFAESFRESEQGKAFYYASGVPVHAMSPFCKLSWLSINDPSLFSKAFKFIGIKEYIFFRLFGVFVVDTAIASATGLLNLQTLQWDETILGFLHLSPDRLSAVVSVKEKFIAPGAKKSGSSPSLLIPEGTPVIIGSSDGAAANLSIGHAGKKAMVMTIGTSSAVRMLTSKAHTDTAMRTFCYHAIDELYIQGGASNNGAIVLEWLKNDLLEAKEDMGSFLKLAETVPAGADGLLLLPYILGERAPLWNAHAKGVFFGLTVNHTKAHMVRSAMEAVIFGMYSIGKVILESNEAEEIYATGGFARSALWVQMVADVFNKQVVLSGSSESSAWGAALIGMEALKLKAGEAQGGKTAYNPDASRHKVYNEQFKKFERLNVLLKSEFDN
ncbi:MAG: gluconokinase, partial [Flavitalea sp.]